MMSAAVGVSLLAGVTSQAFAKVSSVQPLVVLGSPAGSFQNNWNPFGQNNAGTNGMIYQPLYYFNSTANTNAYPLLGTSYKWQDGGKTLVVELRKNVKWSDGQPFTANDVLYTYNTFLKKYPGADGMGVMNRVSQVTANGDYEVAFHFNRVNTPFLIYVLGVDILPEHIWSKQSGDLTKWTNPKPVGTGPFLLSQFSTQAYFMKPNPLYWNGKPKVQSVEFPAYNGNDSADLALADGKIHYGGLFVPNIQKVWVQHNTKTAHYWFPAGAPTMIYPNFNNPLLANVAVRKAISLGINRDPLVNIAEYGYPVAGNPVALPPQFSSFLDPSIKKSDLSFSYSAQQAQQVLDKAGFTKGPDGIYQSPDGKKLQFDLYVVAGWTDWDEACTIIKQQLQQVGIGINVRQVQWGDYANQLWGHPKNGQLVMSWSVLGPTPFYEYYNMMWPRNGNNFSHYVGDATLWLDKYQNSTDPAVQKNAIYQLEHIMINEVPAIPLWNGPTWYEYNTQDYVGWPSAQNPYIDPAPWTYPAMGVVIANLKPAH